MAVLLPLLVLGLSLFLVWQGWISLRVDSIGGDASQNLRSAMNLWQHGVYGESLNPVEAGYRREPLPNWILAAHLKWLVRAPVGLPYADLVADPDLLTRTMQVNLVYLLALFLSLWGLCVRLIRPGWLAHLVAVVVIYFSDNAFAADQLTTLNTELPAALMMTLTALAFVLLRQRHHSGWAILAGLVFGGLVLTKASGSYLALVLLPLIPFLLNHSRRRSLALGLCVALGFALAVLPWVARNLIEFGKPAIARGGADVLMIRSVYNQMTPHEFRGAFYFFAPERLQKDFFEPYLGFSETQRECGGSLERLSRSLPCDERAFAEGREGDVKSFYQIGKRVLPAQIRAQTVMSGIKTPGDVVQQGVALDRIRAAPLKHVLVSLPLSWQALWTFRNQMTWFGVIANGLAMTSLLAMPALGVMWRKPEWVLISIVPVGYFLFYGLFSHFIPRYSEPLIPLSLVCLSLLLLEVIRRVGAPLADRYARGGGR
ncbi:glycosyltransferase family 39 protein [Synechococcus sp. CCY 9618]|uniref:ArnT family glycosyltransferase n=1 Tax=Synechococcus sp. CCY 9618 TaxID=2815602 RepID=UPI001C22811F|nr:glycosyltransferase family 39 protein [Synechococcus sp. CCY 9618]